MKKLTSLLLALTMSLGLTACSTGGDQPLDLPISDESVNQIVDQVLDQVLDDLLTEDPGYDTGSTTWTEDPGTLDSSYTQSDLPEEGEYYYDLENVVLYLEAYGELPDNYITKDEARDLGWEGGTPDEYMDGSAIGGDRFGNREGLLPEFQGRYYTECDLNTEDDDSRGAERLVFSNDGLYFYTDDHYETFTEVWVEDGEVVW